MKKKKSQLFLSKQKTNRIRKQTILSKHLLNLSSKQ